MGIEVPTNIKVLSNDFKELFADVCTEVNRLSNLYADLNRLRAIVDRSGGSASEVTTKFFAVSSGGVIGTYGTLPAIKYTGSVFDVFEDGDGFSKFNVVEGVNGYDLSVVDNLPLVRPAGLSLARDPLEQGTVVLAKELNSTTYMFASVMPRLSVQC
jgi:hypothetical protein